MATLWNDEPALPAPTHINGRVVVAAIKMVTGPGELAHQWVVVCEDGKDLEGTYIVWLAGYDRGGYVASNGNYELTYAQAVARMFERAGEQYPIG